MTSPVLRSIREKASSLFHFFGTVVDLLIVPLVQGCPGKCPLKKEGVANLIGCCYGRNPRHCNMPNLLSPKLP